MYAQTNNKVKVISYLQDLTEITRDHEKELKSAITQMDYMIKERINVENNFVEGLEFLMNNI